MEVVTTEEKGVIRYGDLMYLRQALAEAKNGCVSIPGKMAYDITKNIELINAPSKELEKKRAEILDQFVTKESDGNYKINQPTPEEAKAGKRPEYHYEPGKQEECRKAMDVLLAQEVKLARPFRLTPLSVWNELKIDAAKFPNMGIFIEHFITEEL